MHVLICGAGVGGLSLAQCLRKRGISYEVFDRDEHADARFQGWAIAIHSILGDIKAGFPDDLPDLHDAVNNLQPLDLPAQMGLYFPGRPGRLGVEATPEIPIVRAERRRLRDWLSMNISVQWGKRVVEIEHDDTGVTVRFEDGNSKSGDLLVGADGINSVVRAHLTGKTSDELLKTVPLAAIVGEVDLSGDAFKRQLALGHSLWMYMSPDLGFFNFGGLHYVNPDGNSGRHYWMLMRQDATVDQPEHWLQTATQQDKLDYALETVQKLPPRFREIFELTPVSGIRERSHIWRDLQLDSLPAGRVVLLGDSAHAMTPFRGEGAYHTIIDAMKLAATLADFPPNCNDVNIIKPAVAAYNEEMLERGGEAVRSSRSVQAAAKGPDGKPQLIVANTAAAPLPEVPFQDILKGQPIVATASA